MISPMPTLALRGTIYTKVRNPKNQLWQSIFSFTLQFWLYRQKHQGSHSTKCTQFNCSPQRLEVSSKSGQRGCLSYGTPSAHIPLGFRFPSFLSWGGFQESDCISECPYVREMSQVQLPPFIADVLSDWASSCCSLRRHSLPIATFTISSQAGVVVWMKMAQ